jgi:hypothetical protein
VCTGKFWTHAIPATHHSILREPAVRELGRALACYGKEIARVAGSVDAASCS